jgi:restriction system protein
MSDSFEVPWDEVGEALAMAADEVEGVIAALKQSAKQAVDADRFDEVQRITRQIEGVRQFVGTLDSARREWITLRGESRARRRSPVQAPATKQRRHLGQVAPGAKTSQPDFWRPVLEAVAALGGSGEVSAVLSLIEKNFSHNFKPADRELLPSARKPDDLRWRNTAQWARVELVAEGLLKNDSRRGIWEISDAGRAWLADQRQP